MRTETGVEASDRDMLYFGGAWVRSKSSARRTILNASTEEAIGTVPDPNEEDVDAAVAAARSAFDDRDGWAQWDPARRAEAMNRLADALEARGQEAARTVSAQNGMPLQTAMAFEAGYPAFALRYYAGLVAGSNSEERSGLFGGSTIVRREPVGVVAAIVPWNFPQGLAASKIAPALAAGCTVVLKPAPETALDSFILGEAAVEAGFPAGVLNIVPAGSATGEYLVSHPGIDKVSFTGSTAAGRHLAQLCGGLLRPITLELGGKSAAILLEDAELTDSTRPALFNATMLNNGQTCMLSTRILAPRSRYGEVVDYLCTMANGLKVGNALDPETEIGPLVSQRQRERVEAYIAKGIDDGARLVAGGGRPADQGKGYYVSPTIFADVDNRSTIAQEEIFGPVLAVIAYDGEDEAVRLANESDYGLGGSVWSADVDHAVTVAERVRTGTIGINSYVADPGSPFGGVKSSGIGREMGPEALDAYQVFKSIYKTI